MALAPTVSIMMPAYNAERFVEQTLASIEAQTFADWELVAVDDGSTDGTRALLDKAAQADPRIRVFSNGANLGEGPTRNLALQNTRGAWLYSIDADDLIAPTLLEDTVGLAERSGADIVVFRSELLDNVSGELAPCDWAFERQWFGEDVFRPADYPDHLLNAFQNWSCNKLFRKQLLVDKGISYQNVHRSADIMSTCLALCQANRIALLDKPLHQYRVNNAQSAFATSYRYPLDFLEGFLGLKRELVRLGLFETYRKSFVNHAANSIWANVRVSFAYDSLDCLLRALKEGGAYDELGIADLDPQDAYIPANLAHCTYLMAHDTGHCLAYIADQFARERQDAETRLSCLRVQHAATQRELAARDARIAELEDRVHALEGSTSFKVGRAITSVPRHLRDALRGTGERDA